MTNSGACLRCAASKTGSYLKFDSPETQGKADRVFYSKRVYCIGHHTVPGLPGWAALSLAMCPSNKVYDAQLTEIYQTIAATKHESCT